MGGFLVRDNHHIDEAEKIGDIDVGEILFIGGVFRGIAVVDAAQRLFAVQRRPVLLHPGPQIVFVGYENRVQVAAAVHVVKAIVHCSVLAVMQVHKALNIQTIGPIQLDILPMLRAKLEMIAGLALGKSGDISQGNVHIFANGKAQHGLGQFAHAGHHLDAVVRLACVGIDGILPHFDGNNRWINRIPLGGGEFFQIIIGLIVLVGIGPGRGRMARRSIVPRRENQHAVPAVYPSGNALAGFIGTSFILIQPERHAVDALAVLIHLPNPQLPLLVGDINHGLSVLGKLAHVQKADAAPIGALCHSINLVDQRVDCRLIGRVATIVNPLFHNSCHRFIQLLIRASRYADFRQRLRIDNGIGHLHIGLFE